MPHPLDRPVWNAFTGRQSALAVASGAAVRLDPRYGPFAAARDQGEEAQAALAALLASPGDVVWLVESEVWPAPPGTQVLRTAPLLQMVAELPVPPQPDDARAVLLGEGDVVEMRALAQATEPGPWGELTHRYGNYYGIREGDALQAMAGQRFLPGPGYGEVSGVCTWPEWRGKGLAALLIRRVMAEIVARGETPFLHSYAGNARAIGLYETLGFTGRRPMVVTVLAKA